LRLARVDEAIAQLNIARGEALELANYPYFADLLRMLSTAYEVRGDYQAALNSYKDFHLITLKNRDQRTEISAKLFAAKRDIARAQSEAEAQKHIVHQLEDSNRNLRVQANQDPLTGLPNRRHLEQEMANRFAAHDGQSTFVMCDVDRFKQVNDQFSHTIGDEVLRCIAVLIRANLRTEDMAARIGGEEFALLLDHAKDALEVCERIRKSMESYSWHLIAPGLAVTMSFGYTALRAGDDLNSLMSRADGALYQAKHGGRNCVVKA
jgi:diguanylate cyclase (GGDEF)-like protein